MQPKTVFFVLALLSSILIGATPEITSRARPSQDTKTTFKTPEDAITSYMQGIAQGDFNKIIQACAIDEISQNFKFDLYIDRLRAFDPFGAPPPANAPLNVEIHKAQLRAQIANQVKNLIFGLLSSQPIDDRTIIIRMDLAGATTLMNEIDVKKLAQIQVQKIDLPNKALMTSVKYIDVSTKLARVYGADEATERVVLFSFGADYYWVGFSLLRYGDSWKIYNQNSILANSSARGLPTKTSPADFDRLLNGQ